MSEDPSRPHTRPAAESACPCALIPQIKINYHSLGVTVSLKCFDLLGLGIGHAGERVTRSTMLDLHMSGVRLRLR